MALDHQTKSCVYNCVAAPKRCRRQSERLLAVLETLSEVQKRELIALASSLGIPRLFVASAWTMRAQDPEGAKQLLQNTANIFGQDVVDGLTKGGEHLGTRRSSRGHEPYRSPRRQAEVRRSSTAHFVH